MLINYTYQPSFFKNPCKGYRYSFNGMEKDDEVKGTGNSYTTMFRQYDPRLGRWLTIDPIGALAPGWTPFRFGFDNPILFSDNSGLFETRKEARKYRRDNNLRGHISKNADGSFSIDNRKNKTSISNGEFGIETSVLVQTKKTKTDYALQKWKSWKFNYGGNNASNNSVQNTTETKNNNYTQYSTTDQMLKDDQNFISYTSIIVGGMDTRYKLSSLVKLYESGSFITEYKGDKFIWELNYPNMNLLPKSVQQVGTKAANTLKVVNATKVGAGILNVFAIGGTAMQIYQEGGLTTETALDLVFEGVAFIPVYGWVISTGYFLIKNGEPGDFENLPGRDKSIGGGGLYMCFTKGTLILLPNNQVKTIENMIIGDTIPTYNIQTETLENNIVLEIDSSFQSKFIKITFDNGIININTPNHPYFVLGKGWCSYNPMDTKEKYGLIVNKINQGDVCLFNKNGALIEVMVSSIEEIDKKQITYNLSKVSGNNNFFANGILVHNKYVPQGIYNKEIMIKIINLMISISR